MNNDLTLFGILWGETAYDHLALVFAVLALIGIIFDNKFFYWTSIIVLSVGIYTISETEGGDGLKTLGSFACYAGCLCMFTDWLRGDKFNWFNLFLAIVGFLIGAEIKIC